MWVIKMVLKRIFREKTNRYEYALLSRKTGKPLKWFGIKKPSKEAVLKVERRIQFYRRKRMGL